MLRHAFLQWRGLAAKGCDAADGSRNRRKEAAAYFTAEAAMVVPVVLCLFVMIIYLSFFLYDRCVMAQDLYILSYRQSIEKGGADRAGGKAVREQTAGKLFMLSGLETDTSDSGTVHVRAKGRMDPPVFGLAVFEKEKTWVTGAEGKAKKTDPPKDYRRVRRIMNLAGQALSGRGGDS